MARICKTKGCNNEIPDGWRLPYCDACRYRIAKRLREGAIAVGSTIITVGGAVLLGDKIPFTKGIKNHFK